MNTLLTVALQGLKHLGFVRPATIRRPPQASRPSAAWLDDSPQTQPMLFRSEGFAEDLPDAYPSR